jgi:NADH-quinone oxidoreductase subunit D
MNVATNREAVLGESVADATIILAAVDPCYCCTERMAVIDDTGKRLLSSNELINLSRQKTERIKNEVGAPGPDERLKF